MLLIKISLLQAELETKEQEEAAKLASETEKETPIASPLKEPEPVLQVENSFLRHNFSDIYCTHLTN